MACIYKRGRIYWIQYNIDGDQHNESLRTRSERVALEAKQEIEAGIHLQLISKPTKTPLGPFLQDLCEYWRKIRRGKGAENDISRLRGFFGPRCPALKVKHRADAKFKKAEADYCPPKVMDHKTARHVPIKYLEQLTAGMITRRLQERHLAGEIGGKTANQIRGVLSSMFNYARKHHGYICPDRQYRNPIEGVERCPEQTPIIRWLNHRQIDQQLKVLEPYPQLRAMVAVYIFAGLRRAEGAWLTKGDVDLDKRLIYVRAKEIDGQRWEPKTRKDRTVPISDSLLEILSAYKPARDTPWFFSAPEGGRWQEDNLSAALREINKAAGLEWSCGDYRHTFGSHPAQNGVSLYQISALIHHMSWKQVHRIAAIAKINSNHAGKRLLQELCNYLETIMDIQDQESNIVYVLSLSDKPGRGNSISPVDRVEKYRQYFHPFGGSGWPTIPPNYLAFRYDGILQSIHHVDKCEPVANLFWRRVARNV